MILRTARFLCVDATPVPLCEIQVKSTFDCSEVQINALIIHQIFPLARDWWNRDTWPNHVRECFQNSDHVRSSESERNGIPISESGIAFGPDFGIGLRYRAARFNPIWKNQRCNATLRVYVSDPGACHASRNRSGSMDVALVEIIVEFTKAHIKPGSFCWMRDTFRAPFQFVRLKRTKKLIVLIINICAQTRVQTTVVHLRMHNIKEVERFSEIQRSVGQIHVSNIFLPIVLELSHV